MTNPDRAKATESADGPDLIKQALAALDRARPLPADVWALPSEALGIARAALQHAALEAEFWRVIDDAVTSGKVSIGSVMGCVTNRMITGDSRLEALTAAARWCRAESMKPLPALPDAPKGEP